MNRWRHLVAAAAASNSVAILGIYALNGHHLILGYISLILSLSIAAVLDRLLTKRLILLNQLEVNLLCMGSLYLVIGLSKYFGTLAGFILIANALMILVPFYRIIFRTQERPLLGGLK